MFIEMFYMWVLVNIEVYDNSFLIQVNIQVEVCFFYVVKEHTLN